MGVWIDHCLHHEESFTDKRHNTIIVAPCHQHFIKNKTLTRYKWAQHMSWFQQTVNSALSLPRTTAKQAKSRTHQTAFKVHQHLGSETDPRRCMLQVKKDLLILRMKRKNVYQDWCEWILSWTCTEDCRPNSSKTRHKPHCDADIHRASCG